MTIPTATLQAAPSSAYPDGWFALCFASDLKPKSILIRPFMDSELVLYRTASGIVRAIPCYCPHLGAHLGRGGKVVGENIVCPFHHFAFSTNGQCVSTPSGIKPPNASLGSHPVQEWNGLILVWQGTDNPQNIWKLPELELAGFCAPFRGSYKVRGNLQNITENAFDVNHFAPLHNWMKALMQPPLAENHQLKVQFNMEVFGLAVQANISLYGLGIMVAQLTQKRLGLYATLLITPTQTGPQQWEFKDLMVLRLAKLSKLPRWLSTAINTVLAAAAYRLWYVPALKNDIVVWDHRNYDIRPKLIANEGPIVVFRRWASQFFQPCPSRPNSGWQRTLSSRRPMIYPAPLHKRPRRPRPILEPRRETAQKN